MLGFGVVIVLLRNIEAGLKSAELISSYMAKQIQIRDDLILILMPSAARGHHGKLPHEKSSPHDRAAANHNLLSARAHIRCSLR